MNSLCLLRISLRHTGQRGRRLLHRLHMQACPQGMTTTCAHVWLLSDHALLEQSINVLRVCSGFSRLAAWQALRAAERSAPAQGD